MQTTKWGPPAWRLLFAMASNYPESPTSKDKDTYLLFFNHIGNILPCIYCRQSYREFMIELPLVDWLKDRQSMMNHLYLIHNKVNEKLRQQGYLTALNPPFQEIYNQYDRQKTYTDCGWDFLYAVIFNYPESPKEIDQYNYRLFFEQLRLMLPYQPVQQFYTKYYHSNPINNYLSSRKQITHWFYQLHQSIVTELHRPDHQSYQDLCEKYEKFRASCNTAKTNTCRIQAK